MAIFDPRVWLVSLLLWFALLYPLWGQEQPASPRERALMERVSIEINNNLACSTSVQALQDRIRELEQKAKADIKITPQND